MYIVSTSFLFKANIEKVRKKEEEKRESGVGKISENVSSFLPWI